MTTAVEKKFEYAERQEGGNHVSAHFMAEALIYAKKLVGKTHTGPHRQT